MQVGKSVSHRCSITFIFSIRFRSQHEANMETLPKRYITHEYKINARTFENVTTFLTHRYIQRINMWKSLRVTVYLQHILRISHWRSIIIPVVICQGWQHKMNICIEVHWWRIKYQKWEGLTVRILPICRRCMARCELMSHPSQWPGDPGQSVFRAFHKPVKWQPPTQNGRQVGITFPVDRRQRANPACSISSAAGERQPIIM